jgi:TRAP-type C4-dicarboxylate transport system substrate-binding protein
LLGKLINVSVAGAALTFLGIAPASAQKQTLHMAYFAGPSHHMVQTLAAWIKTVEEASGGNLVIELDKAALGKTEGQYDLVRNGVRDLAWAVPSRTPGRFDMLQAAEIPFLCPSSTVCAVALWRWYAKYGLAAKEFPDTVLLTTFTTGPFGIHTGKPVKTLEDLKGLKINGGPSAVPIAKGLGISLATLNATETYEAVQRGTVDGTLFPWEAMQSFRLNELLKAHLEIPGGILAATFVVVANPKAVDNLTPENKAALMKASGETGSALFGKAWDAADERGRADAKERGQLIETLAPAELAGWRSMIQFVPDEWVKKAEQKGYDGRKMLADLEAMIRDASS